MQKQNLVFLPRFSVSLFHVQLQMERYQKMGWDSFWRKIFSKFLFSILKWSQQPISKPQIIIFFPKIKILSLLTKAADGFFGKINSFIGIILFCLFSCLFWLSIKNFQVKNKLWLDQSKPRNLWKNQNL